MARASLQMRYGATGKLDLWIKLPFQSIRGGCLDHIIEWFLRIGFNQYGRNKIAHNENTADLALGLTYTRHF